MKTNTIVKILLAGNQYEHVPGYRPTGCYFVVTECRDNPGKFAVCCPASGYCITTCSQQQTAIRFANIVHDLLVRSKLFESYANADANDTETRKSALENSGLKNYWHLRLCKPGQFESALAEVESRRYA